VEVVLEAVVGTAEVVGKEIVDWDADELVLGGGGGGAAVVVIVSGGGFVVVGGGVGGVVEVGGGGGGGGGGVVVVVGTLGGPVLERDELGYGVEDERDARRAGCRRGWQKISEKYCAGKKERLTGSHSHWKKTNTNYYFHPFTLFIM
jgi:hypothetical protein